MIPPNPGLRPFTFGAISLALLAGCSTPQNKARIDDATSTSVGSIKEKSLYEMAVSNEATRLRKENPALSRQEALTAARGTISLADYNPPESPEELKAKKLKQARAEFAANFEKTMRQ